jgi:hypothetical protein
MTLGWFIMLFLSPEADRYKHVKPLATELNPICNYGNFGSWQSVYTQL